MRRRSRWIPTCLCLALGLAAPGAGQGIETRPWPHEHSDLPPRPSVRYGALENGLRYAWAPCDQPAQAVRIWLHVAVGSLMEGPGEEGLAHFVEHLVFRGTEGWPEGALDRWAAENGIASGPDLNAFTGPTSTTYLIDLPSNEPALVGEALEVLRELATRPLFEPQAIEAELPVIDAEERERRSAGGGIGWELDRWAHQGLAFVEHPVIGLAASRVRFDRELVRAFHRRWYRPERMTLLLAGDLAGDPLPLLRAAFGDLAHPAQPPPGEPDPGALEVSEPLLVLPESELTGVGITLRSVRQVAHRPPTRERLKEALARAVGATLVGRRLTRLREERPELLEGVAVELVGSVPWAPLVGFDVEIHPCPGRWREALARVEQELRRVRLHGFGAGELARTVEEHRREIEQTIASEKLRNAFEEADWLLIAAEDAALDYDTAALQEELEELIDGLDPERVQRSWNSLWCDLPLLALVGDLEPERDTRQALAEVWRESCESEVAERAFAPPRTFAYHTADQRPGAILEEQDYPELELRYVHFENDVHLYLAPAEGDRAEVRLFLRGGQMSLPPGRWDFAWVAEDLAVAMGLEAHPQAQLERILEGHDLSLLLTVEEDAIVLGGEIALTELDLELELCAAYLTHLAWRPELLEAWARRYPEEHADLLADPWSAVGARFFPEVFAEDEPRWIPDPQALADFPFDELQRWLTGELRSAPLSVVIWGGSDPDRIVESVARTLGNLPARRDPRPYVGPLMTHAPAQGLRREYSLPAEAEGALVFLLLPTTDGRVDSRAWGLSLLADVLAQRLERRVREELGLAYAPQVHSYASQVFARHGYLSLAVVAGPADVERVEEVSLAVLEELGERGLGAEELERIRRPRLAEHAGRYWLDVLSDYSRHPDAIGRWWEEGEFYRTVQPARLNRYARRFLRRGRASIAVLEPGE